MKKRCIEEHTRRIRFLFCCMKLPIDWILFVTLLWHFSDINLIIFFNLFDLFILSPSLLNHTVEHYDKLLDKCLIDNKTVDICNKIRSFLKENKGEKWNEHKHIDHSYKPHFTDTHFYMYFNIRKEMEKEDRSHWIYIKMKKKNTTHQTGLSIYYRSKWFFLMFFCDVCNNYYHCRGVIQIYIIFDLTCRFYITVGQNIIIEYK